MWHRLLTVLLLAGAAVAADPVPRGARVLGIDVNPEQGGDFLAAWALAESCGIQDAGLSLDWNYFESGVAGVFADPGGWLAAANAFYPAQGVSLTLTLRPLHNSVKPVPADLASTPFEDPAHTMATRFCALLDWVIPQLPAVTFEALVIGSEYDVYLAAHPSEWPDYGWFMSRVATHVRNAPYASRIPRIAAEATFDGYVGQPTGVAAINGVCDVAGVSYYAIGAGFAVKSQATVRADLDSLLGFASASKPLCFYQLGCPSSWRDGAGAVHDRSAEQAEFIRTAFSFWDANAATVRLMDMTWLHDLGPADLAVQEAYFGLSDPAFLTFLGSLGLRAYAGGAPKTAWTALRSQASTRGWGDPVTPGGSGSSTGAGTVSGGSSGGGCGLGGGLASLIALLAGAAARARPSVIPLRRAAPRSAAR